LNTLKSTLAPHAWKVIHQLLGESPETLVVRELLDNVERQQDRIQEHNEQLGRELDKVREERLGWQAKEATVRKELQDCQERSKDLLEQVVRLTHAQREVKKNLLDQQFKTAATPLERNRFEMELTEARGKVRRAEEAVKAAEEKLATSQKRQRELEKEANRVKQLESDLAWEKQKSAAHLQGVGLAVERIRHLEARLHTLEEAALKTPPRKYTRPAIRKARRALQQAFESVQEKERAA
jgi:chromosome segregation ATPase